jgi:sodium transport system permease protein
MVLAFISLKTQPWMSLIPTFSQQLLINQVMRGEPLNMTFVIVSAVTTVVAGLVLTWAAIRLYGSERVLFGG